MFRAALIPPVSKSKSMAQKLQITCMQLQYNSAASYLPSQCFGPCEPRADQTGSRERVRGCSGLVRAAALPHDFALFYTLDSPRVTATIDRTQQKLKR
jgi:hypothetical protein